MRKKLVLSKVGNVKAVFHRALPAQGLKTCTVVRESNGEWYSCLVYEDHNLGPILIQSRFQSPVGIDLGLKSLMTTTDGAKVPHPRFLLKAETRLKRLQGRLSRTRKGSKNRSKARMLFAVQSSKVTRQRRDFNHKLSTELVRKHDLIVFEDLKIQNMIKNHALAKSINDAAWCQLQAFAKYKAMRKGGLVVNVPSAYSTQECYFCSSLNQVPLSVRAFGCRGCGRTLDRDFNAAWIVLKRGLAQVGQDMPELKPVEIRPPPTPMTECVRQVDEAGTTRHEIGAESPRCSVAGDVATC